MDSNEKAVDLGYDYAKEHFSCPLPIHLEKMDATKDSILIDGNTRRRSGALYAGATVGAWYPITPATSLMEAFRGFCKRYRRDPETQEEPGLHHPGRGRAGGHRHGDRRGVGGRARVHADGGPGHLADERVHRPRLLRRGAGGHLRRAAHRPVDRHADAHAAGRSDDVRLRVARRHAAHLPVSGRSARGVRARGQGVRSRRPLPDAGVRAERSRHRHERLDGPEAHVGRQLSPGSRQGAVGRGARQGQDVLPLSRFGRRRHHLSHATRARIRRARSSRAARATTGSAATPRTPTNTPR